MSQTQAAKVDQTPALETSKPVQSLGWIDRLLGDRKIRERARKRAQERAEVLARMSGERSN